MRRKSKDNPYEIIISNNVYMIKFKDAKNRVNIITVNEEIYNAFDRFELDDISQMHKYERHIEHKEIYETNLYYRMEHKELLVEEQVMKKMQIDRLYNAISKLSETQQRRLKMYYFDDLSLREIARVEECSIHSVFVSIERAKENLRKILN